MRLHIPRKKITILSAVFVVFGLVFFGASAYAAQSITDMSTDNDNNPNVWHSIVFHSSNRGSELNLKAYYSSYSSSDTVEITKATYTSDSDYPPCRASSAIGNTQDHAQVIITAGSGSSARSITYNIEKRYFCNSGSATNTRNAPNNARMFGTYQLPVYTQPSGVAGTQVTITVKLHSNVTSGTPPSTIGSAVQAYFRVRTPNAFVGPRSGFDVNTRANAGSGYRSHVALFGSSCSITAANPWRTVQVTDPDNYNRFGDISPTQGGASGEELYFYVEQRDIGSTGAYTALPTSDYRYSEAADNVDATIIGGKRVFIPDSLQNIGGVSGNATVDIHMRADKAYRLVVERVYYLNVLQLRIPTDAIYNRIGCDYNLIPSTTGSATSVSANDSITVTPRVNNSGRTTDDPIDWRLVTFTASSASAGSIPTTLATDTVDPRTHYGFGATNVASGSQIFEDGTTTVAAGSRAVPDVPVGTRVCWALSVRPYSRASASNEWRYGVPYCVVVSKGPLVQVRGSDVIVGRSDVSSADVITNTKDSGGLRYGSWGEYGIIASGTVFGMASATGYAGGSSTTTLCGASLLTFANRPNATGVCDDNNVGGYTFKATTQTIASKFPATSAAQIAGNQAIGSFANRGVYTNNAADADINLTAGPGETIPAGKWFVINAPNATVRIMNNIVYTGAALTSISQIPQVVIIAENIIVADSVSQVDAWLVATGTEDQGVLNTCGAGGVGPATTLTAALCGTRLTVNGPVIANHLLLRRTAGAGSGASSGDPAEVFNLRPDAYLWASGLQTSTYKARTVMTTELPPRY